MALSPTKQRLHTVPPLTFIAGEESGKPCCQYEDCSRLGKNYVGGNPDFYAVRVCDEHLNAVMLLGDKVYKDESTCPLRPLNGFIILERFKKEEFTRNGIARPQNQQIPIDKGRIVAIGDPLESDLRTVPLPNVKVGDIVHFATGAGLEIELEDAVYFSLPARNIICVEKQ